MACERSLGGPGPPAGGGDVLARLWAAATAGTGRPVPGRLLLRDIAARQQAAAGAPQQQASIPRWGVPRGSGAVSADRPAAPAGGGGGGGSAPGGAPLLQLVLADEALSDIPVPTVYLGGLPAPIPAGRPTIDADELVRQLQQGQLPSDSLPEGDREAWRAASRITDPISAYNICQAQQLAGGRRVVLTERGVAEQLARGAIQMVPAGSAAARGGSGTGGLPNPFAPLLRLASSLAEGRDLARKVQSRAATLQHGGSGAGSQQQAAAAGSGSAAQPAPATAAEPPASPPPSVDGEPRQYFLQDVPARRLLAGGSPPQLAWVPLRVALALLRALPQHFMLAQGVAPAGGLPQAKQRRHKGEAGEAGSEACASVAGAARSTFKVWSSPSALEVCVIPGLTIQQVTPEGSVVEFTPAFVSHGSAQALWRDVREISGGALLMYRRLERSLMRRRLEAAAALIASGGLRGQQGGSAAAQDDEEGGMEEPPEIAEFIRELGSSLGADPSALSGGGGLQPPSGGLPRLVATFACGCVSLAAQGLSWAGNTADWLLMATPLGPRLLGIPEAAIERHTLADLLAAHQRYNRDQALLRCVVHSTATQLAAAKRQHDAGPAQQQGAGGAARDGGAAQGAEPAAAQQPEPPPSQGSAAAAPAPQAAGADAAAAPPTPEAQHAAAAALAEEASLRYRRLLAAAAIWVGLAAKTVGEDPGTGGGSLGRLLAKSLLQQGTAVSAAALGGLAGSTRLRSQVSLPTGAPSLHAPAHEAPPSMQEAVEQVISAGLPLLEHNGFAPLFAGSPPGGGGAADAGTGGGAPVPAALAAAVAAHCTADTHLGLGLTRDGGSGGGGYRLLASNPLAPPPAGRGLMLVGELDLGMRPRGRTAGRTTARWLTVGVDDGRRLL